MKKVIKLMIPNLIKKKYRKYKIKSFEGDNVTCTICNSNFKIFGTTGVIKRRNAKCHNCDSLERHRLIWKYINDKLNIINSNENLRILHFAPEKMFYKIFSKLNNIEYVPCDLFPELFDFEGSIKVLKTDITNIQFDNEYFDFILCNHILEHIQDDRLAMSELYRVMKKGGSGIFQVPIDYTLEDTYEDFSIKKPKEREKAFGQADHVRWYGKDYIKRLESVGFKVTEDNFVNEFSPEEQIRYGFIKSEMIYYCKK